MKKKDRQLLSLMCAFMCILSFGAAQAQSVTSKSHWMVGSGLNGGVALSKNHPPFFNWSLRPQVGYFIENNLAVGLIGETGFINTSGGNQLSLGISPFARWYFTSGERLQLFTQVEAGFLSRHGSLAEEIGNRSSVIGKIGIGASYRISNRFSLEAQWKTEFEYAPERATVRGNGPFLGINFHIPGRKSKITNKRKKTNSVQ